MTAGRSKEGRIAEVRLLVPEGGANVAGAEDEAHEQQSAESSSD